MGQHKVTRPASPCRVQMNKTVSQEQLNVESGSGYGVDSRSGSIIGSDFKTGRILNRSMGLGLNHMSPSPSELNRPIPDGSTSPGHKGFETMLVGGETELNQDPVLRPPMSSVGRGSTPSEPKIVEEGNDGFSREEGEIREDLPQDDGCVHMERYVNKYND